MSTTMSSHLSIADLFSRLQKSSNEETAIAVTQAFEQFREEQKAEAVANKKEILAEINIKDLTTKDDLALAVTQIETKMAIQDSKTYKYISEAKWQVVGVIALFFLTAIVAKHFGLI